VKNFTVPAAKTTVMGCGGSFKLKENQKEGLLRAGDKNFRWGRWYRVGTSRIMEKGERKEISRSG